MSLEFVGAIVLGVALVLETGLRDKRFGLRARRFDAYQCPECGYSLIGLPSDVCPECGWSKSAE